jgi:exopolyphosphatase / guanosine-5'-triphosphate,3'-diphosphate pyrophosphatase
MPITTLETSAAPEKPVAVVDIGSNSVRLVVYDGLRRSPSPVFNEKVLCGLGKGVAITGLLAETGILRALNELRRFKAICKLIGVKEIYAVATAAAREAKNGPDFIAKAEKALGAPIEVLTGKEEAEYAALGVISGIPDADGIAGDLGGGSLELVDIKGDQVGKGITLPLGALRLIDLSEGSLAKAREIIDETLSRANILADLKDRDFYAVGGTWRNLARLHMAQVNYPLHVLHNYAIPFDAARSVAGLVSGLSVASLKDVTAVSRSRADTLPFGALVLDRLLAQSEPRNVVFSVFGVREGLLYKRLKRRRQDSDPLISAAWDFARRYARSPEHERELCDWTDQFFGTEQLPEDTTQRRLRHAACLLADIGWRAHPDYRGERSMTMISQASFVGVDHPGRLFLALTVFYRYEGPGDDRAPSEFRRLVGKDMKKRAEILAAAMRLAYVLTAAMPGVLPKIRMSVTPGGNLVLKMPKKLTDLMGERVEKRLGDLATILGCTPAVEI